MTFRWTQERAEHIARCAIRLKDPKDAKPIAEIAVKQDCCIWHASALFYCSECQCGECVKRPRPVA